MEIKNIKLEAIFFQTENGIEPVREWLKELTKADKKIIGEDILTVQYSWPIGMPLVDHLGQGLWEVRSKLSGRRIARIIFFMDGNAMILVNGFIKTTRKTPKQELDISKERKKQFLRY